VSSIAPPIQCFDLQSNQLSAVNRRVVLNRLTVFYYAARPFVKKSYGEAMQWKHVMVWEPASTMGDATGTHDVLGSGNHNDERQRVGSMIRCRERTV